MAHFFWTATDAAITVPDAYKIIESSKTDLTKHSGRQQSGYSTYFETKKV